MTEDEFISMMFTIMALGTWVLWLLLSNRRLKKKLKALQPAPAPVVAAPVMSPPHETSRREEEIDQLRKRVQVLERIAVEKENSLAREIDSLRHA